MTKSTPGILISRNGEVRDYVGHSNRTGTVYGYVLKQGSGVWLAVCAGCGHNWYRAGRGDSALLLRDHWRNADSPMAATHQQKPEAADV